MCYQRRLYTKYFTSVTQCQLSQNRVFENNVLYKCVISAHFPEAGYTHTIYFTSVLSARGYQCRLSWNRVYVYNVHDKCVISADFPRAGCTHTMYLTSVLSVLTFLKQGTRIQCTLQVCYQSRLSWSRVYAYNVHDKCVIRVDFPEAGRTHTMYFTSVLSVLTLLEQGVRTQCT